MSATEPRSPLARCLRAGWFGVAKRDEPVVIAERRVDVVRVLARRGEDDALGAAFQGDLGLTLPQAGHASAGTGGTDAIWIAPETWLVLQPSAEAGSLRERVAATCGERAAVVDQSGGWMVLRIAGARTRDVLAKGCRIDLHPRVFGPHRAAATIIAHVHCIVRQVDDSPAFELMVPSTLAEHVFEWLCLSAAEFGYEVRA